MIKMADVLATMDRHMMIGQPGHSGLPRGIDGGDTVNRMSHYGFLGKALRITFPFSAHEILDTAPHFIEGDNYARSIIPKFESEMYPGNYVRHFDPEQGKHGTVAYCEGDWKGVESRDQGIPIRLCLGLYGEYEILWRAFKASARRFFVFQNNTIGNGVDWRDAERKIPDPTGPEFWAIYIRGFFPYTFFLWPLLFVLDLETLLGSILWRFRTKDPNKDDVINHCSVCINGMLIMPTLTIWLACKINSPELMMEKLRHYWCKWRESCYFVQLYEPLVRYYFG